MDKSTTAINCNVTVILEEVASAIELGANMHCREYVAALGDDGFMSDLTIFCEDLPVAVFCCEGVDEPGIRTIIDQVEEVLCASGWQT